MAGYLPVRYIVMSETQKLLWLQIRRVLPQLNMRGPCLNVDGCKTPVRHSSVSEVARHQWSQGGCRQLRSYPRATVTTTCKHQAVSTYTPLILN